MSARENYILDQDKNSELDPPSPELFGKEKLTGVYSTTVKAKIGFGHTRRNTTQTVYMYVTEEDGGSLYIQPLNDNYVPIGDKKTIAREVLLTEYLPEPAVYMGKVYPVMRQLSKTIARGEKHLSKGETFSAEYEFKTALRIDEENIRATFGLGLTYLERNETDRGALVFRRLVKLKGAFEPQHKHLFNEFGMKLRKNKMFDHALKYYSRAFQFSKNDENLMYNIARVMYDKGNVHKCIIYLEKALSMNPDFDEAKGLLAFAKKKIQRDDAPNAKRNSAEAPSERDGMLQL